MPNEDYIIPKVENSYKYKIEATVRMEFSLPLGNITKVEKAFKNKE